MTFTDDTTSPTPNSDTDASGNSTGNPFASLAFGYGDNVNASSQLVVTPSVANRSLETGFYVQDDWKITSKLTLNLGLRYQWSSPYTSRGNQIEFSNFTANSGVSIPLNTVPAAAPAGTLSTQSMLQSAGLNLPASTQLLGTTQFATSSMRTVPTYCKDVGPRLGFSYQLDQQTVVRGGAGIYFGMSPATNFQYPGAAFLKTANLFFTNDNFATQSATLENPFPAGYTGPQGRQYGQFANWGYPERERSGHDGGARRQHLPVESGNPAAAPQPDRARRGLLREPKHPSTLVRHQQPRLHPVCIAGPGYGCCHSYGPNLPDR